MAQLTIPKPGSETVLDSIKFIWIPASSTPGCALAAHWESANGKVLVRIFPPPHERSAVWEVQAYNFTDIPSEKNRLDRTTNGDPNGQAAQYVFRTALEWAKNGHPKMKEARKSR